MSEKPIVRHEVNLEKPKHRDEDPSRFLGPPKMIIRAFKHEKDRIQVFTMGMLNLTFCRKR